MSPISYQDPVGTAVSWRLSLAGLLGFAASLFGCLGAQSERVEAQLGDPGKGTRVSVIPGIPSDSLLTAISFSPSGARVVAIGGNKESGPAEIIRSVDGGRKWVRDAVGFKGRLYDLQFVGEQTVIAVGLKGRIARSVDGGGHWNSVRDGDEWLAGVAAVSKTRLLAVGRGQGGGLILLSRDVGKSWSPGPEIPASSRSASPRAIAFRDARRGVIVGTDGLLLVSQDGGRSWSSRSSGGGYLRAIEFQGARSIWVVGAPGVVIRSGDGGESWTKLPFPRKLKLNSIRFADARRGWVTSMEGALFETRDGGGKWQLIHQTKHRALCGTRIRLAEGRGIICGDLGTILRLRWKR